MQLLPYNTVTYFSIGPVSATDGFTALTSLTATNISQMSILKEGSAALFSVTDNTFTHLAGGIYRVQLTVANLNTVGKLDFYLSATNSYPLRKEFMVCPTSVYDALVLGTEKLPVDLQQINQVSTAANNLGKMAAGGVPFIVAAGASTVLIPTDLTNAVNDHYNGRTVIFTSGTLAGQAASITDYNGATKELTISTLTSAPANGTTGVII